MSYIIQPSLGARFLNRVLRFLFGTKPLPEFWVYESIGPRSVGYMDQPSDICILLSLGSCLPWTYFVRLLTLGELELCIWERKSTTLSGGVKEPSIYGNIKSLRPPGVRLGHRMYRVPIAEMRKLLAGTNRPKLFVKRRGEIRIVEIK